MLSAARRQRLAEFMSQYEQLRGHEQVLVRLVISLIFVATIVLMTCALATIFVLAALFVKVLWLALKLGWGLL